jgi:putative membrane protein
MVHFDHGAVGSWGAMVFTLFAVITAVAYVWGWLGIRSDSGKGIAAWRAGSFLAGLFMIWVAVASPIAMLDERLLTVHMIQHLLLMTLASPLIWLGEPVLALLNGLPQRLTQPVVRKFRQTVLRQFWTAITRPTFSLLAASAVLVGWHIPALFMLGMHSEMWHAVEQTSFLATGLLFWWPVIQPWPDASGQNLSIILYLFLATLPCDILSGFLVFSDRVVYPMYFSVSQPFGLTALEDQQCAGALMWTCVTVVYLVAGAMLTVRLLRPAQSS